MEDREAVACRVLAKSWVAREKKHFSLSYSIYFHYICTSKTGRRDA